MDSQSRDYKFLFYLCGITLAGLLLRLNHLGAESITADEVSALLRLQFNSFSEMLEGGVKPDGHPAFTQALLWFWIKVFGDTEFSIRLPFVLMGTASIWLAGVTTKRWFGIGAALAVATSLAFLQFTIMYSQLARPYAPGLFFTMLAAYFVSRFSQDEKVKWTHIVGFAIAGACAAYSHYFSLLTTLLLGIAGVILVAKTNRTKYFIACAAAVLLFLPHISFTLSQMEIGGIGGPGGWLAAPTPAFFQEHLFYIFNSSRGILILVCTVAFVCFVFNKRRMEKRQIAVLMLWLLPMFIGYFYSVYKNPLLQNSTLLFSFPFLLMFIFSWMPSDALSKWPYRFALVVILPMAYYITVHKPFRLTEHFGRLKELVEVYERTSENDATHNVDAMFNVDANYFLDYYGIGPRRVALPEEMYLQHSDTHDELLQLRSKVQSSTADYFVYGWSTRESSPASLDIIAEEFPCLVEKHEWFNSAVYVFSKDGCGKLSYISPAIINCVAYYFQTFKENNASTTHGKWIGIAKFVENRIPLEGSPFTPSNRFASEDYILLDRSTQFSPVFVTTVENVIYNPDNEIVFESLLRLGNSESEAVLVVEFTRNGKQLLWTGASSKHQLDSTEQDWQMMHFVQRPAIELEKTDSIKAYIFTPDLWPVHVGMMHFMTREGHRGIYGHRPDYE